MDSYEDKLHTYLTDHNIQAEHLLFTQSCHSVAEAAQAAQATAEDFIKSVCLVDHSSNLIVAIIKGEDRLNRKLVGQALGIPNPRLAKPDEILEKSGYPCGGVPPFGYQAKFLMDHKVLERRFILGGGGSEKALIKLAPQEILRINQACIVSLRVE